MNLSKPHIGFEVDLLSGRKRFVLRIDVHETDMCRLEKPNMKDNWSVKRFTV